MERSKSASVTIYETVVHHSVMILKMNSASTEIINRVKLQWIQRTQIFLFTSRRPVVSRGNSFWGRVALKLVVTKLVRIKLVINLWQSARPQKSYCENQPVYAIGGYTRSLKTQLTCRVAQSRDWRSLSWTRSEVDWICPCNKINSTSVCVN